MSAEQTLVTHLNGGGQAEVRDVLLWRPSVKPDATRPSSPRVGQMHFNSNDACLEVWDGSAWQQLKPATVTAADVASVSSSVTALGSRVSSLEALPAAPALSSATPASDTTAGTAGTAATASRGDHAHPLPTNYNAQAVSNVSVALNNQTGTTYTLQASDNGKVVTLSNAAAITLTVPSGLPVGYNVMLVQLGIGQVTVAGSGVTVRHRQSHNKLAGQYAEAVLTVYASNLALFAGDTA